MWWLHWLDGYPLDPFSCKVAAAAGDCDYYVTDVYVMIMMTIMCTECHP